MFSSLYPQRKAVKVFIIVTLMLLLTSCNGSDTTTRKAANSSPSTPSTPSTSSTFNAGIGFDVVNKDVKIHVQSARGIRCPTYESAALPSGHLVLATNRLSFDTGEVHQMVAYLNAYHDNAKVAPGVTQGFYSYPPLPAAFQIVQGANVNEQLYFGPNGELAHGTDTAECRGYLEITNTGQNAILVSQIDMRLMETPHKNNEQYRLVDFCSQLPESTRQDRCPPGGAGGPINEPKYYFPFKNQNTGTVFQAQYSPSPFGIIPDQTVEAELVMASPDNLIYSVTPELIVYSPGGLSTINLSQLNSTLAFANKKQFSCYSLQGDTFVQVIPDPEFLKAWCL